MRDVIIIGSGPAGLTAAVYTARANLNPLLIEGLEAGGQLMMTTEVENYPGFRSGVLGPDLMAEMRAQAERFGTEIVQGDVSVLELGSAPFTVSTNTGTHQTKSLILATGASARLLGLESERKLMGHGVSTCATCDGYFFRDKPIVVVGGGDSAMEEATFLTKFASHVTLVHRREEFRASKFMQDKARANEKISFELGYLRFLQQDFEGALLTLDNIDENSAYIESSLLLKAEINDYILNDKSKAVEIYLFLLDTFPNSIHYDKTRQRLRSLAS